MRATAQQMYAVEAVLRHTLKFRQEPFEWVYQGYAPLLLPSVVSSRCATTSLCMHVVAAFKRSRHISVSMHPFGTPKCP